MPCQTRQAVKKLIALSTTVWFLAGMNNDMSLITRLKFELFVTVWTFEGFFVAMNRQVPFQGG